MATTICSPSVGHVCICTRKYIRSHILTYIPYTRAAYHLGWTDDLILVIRWLHEEDPRRRIYLTGFSVRALASSWTNLSHFLFQSIMLRIDQLCTSAHTLGPPSCLYIRMWFPQTCAPKETQTQTHTTPARRERHPQKPRRTGRGRHKARRQGRRFGLRAIRCRPLVRQDRRRLLQPPSLRRQFPVHA